MHRVLFSCMSGGITATSYMLHNRNVIRFFPVGLYLGAFLQQDLDLVNKELTPRASPAIIVFMKLFIHPTNFMSRLFTANA